MTICWYNLRSFTSTLTWVGRSFTLLNCVDLRVEARFSAAACSEEEGINSAQVAKSVDDKEAKQRRAGDVGICALILASIMQSRREDLQCRVRKSMGGFHMTTLPFKWVMALLTRGILAGPTRPNQVPVRKLGRLHCPSIYTTSAFRHVRICLVAMKQRWVAVGR